MTTTLNTLLITFDTGPRNANKAAACETVIQAVAKKRIKLFDGCWIIADPQNADEWLKRLDKAGPKSFDFALIVGPISTATLNGLLTESAWETLARWRTLKPQRDVLLPKINKSCAENKSSDTGSV